GIQRHTELRTWRATRRDDGSRGLRGGAHAVGGRADGCASGACLTLAADRGAARLQRYPRAAAPCGRSILGHLPDPLDGAVAVQADAPTVREVELVLDLVAAYRYVAAVALVGPTVSGPSSGGRMLW